MKNTEFEIPMDVSEISIDGKTPPDWRCVKSRYFSIGRRNGGGSLPETSRKKTGKESGWKKGPGKHNADNIPNGSCWSGGPWTGKNGQPAPGDPR